MQRCKKDNVVGDQFNKSIYEKMKTDTDAKLNYIKCLFEGTSQFRFDLDFFTRTTDIYIRTIPSSSQVEEVSVLSKYIHDELANLRRASIESISMENKVVVDEGNAGAVQDKALRLQSLNEMKDKLDTKSNEVYNTLASVMDKFKEVQDRAETEGDAGGGGVNIGNTRQVLKPIDSLKPLDCLKHNSNCFEFHTWYEGAEAWGRAPTLG